MLNNLIFVLLVIPFCMTSDPTDALVISDPDLTEICDLIKKTTFAVATAEPKPEVKKCLLSYESESVTYSLQEMENVCPLPDLTSPENSDVHSFVIPDDVEHFVGILYYLCAITEYDLATGGGFNAFYCDKGLTWRPSRCIDPSKIDWLDKKDEKLAKGFMNVFGFLSFGCTLTTTIAGLIFLFFIAFKSDELSNKGIESQTLYYYY